ncbi:hypothetical protein D3C85_1130540 [compost metagenome]
MLLGFFDASAIFVDAEPGNVNMFVFIVVLRTVIDDFGEFANDFLVVLKFEALGIDYGDRVTFFGDFFRMLCDGLARAGFSQFSSEYAIDQGAFPNTGFPCNDDIHFT